MLHEFHPSSILSKSRIPSVFNFLNNVTIVKTVLNKKQSPQSDARTGIPIEASVLLVLVLCVNVFFKDYNFNIYSFFILYFETELSLAFSKAVVKALDALVCEMVCRLAGLLCGHEAG